MAQKFGAVSLYLLVMFFGVALFASLHVNGSLSQLWSNVACGVLGFVAMMLLHMSLDTKP